MNNPWAAGSFAGKGWAGKGCAGKGCAGKGWAGKGWAGDAWAGDAWGGETSHEELINQVKEMQRNEPQAKEQWVLYTDSCGGGTRDPSKHPGEFLQEFLTQYTSGARLQGQVQEVNGLPDVVKIMQKRSSNFKQVWAQFCTTHAQGRCDPQKHDFDFHVRFLETLADTAISSGGLSNSPEQSGPPNKRPRGDVGASLGFGNSAAEPQKDQLVSQVKAFQRTGPDEKELWAMYANTYLGGVLDPSRHDENTLREFCLNHRVPPAGSPGGGSGGGLGFGLSMADAPEMDPEKEAIVQRVKAFQKQSPDNYELWSTFCGKTRDPSRHEMPKLLEFCHLYGLGDGN